MIKTMARSKTVIALITAAIGMGTVAVSTVHGHGDVNPQPVKTPGLPELSEWKTTNPYRELGGEVYETAVRIGERGYGANCAACHGLGGVSGGIAPDLRMLEPGFDDEYYISKIRSGARGMPSFEGVLSQEALWAIKSWLDTLHEGAMEDRYGQVNAAEPTYVQK